MENMKAKDLMIPVEKFPKISAGASFQEALSTLKKAQEDFLSKKTGQRILLVENEQGQVMGKISPIDLIRGLETNYKKVNFEKTLSDHGLSYVANAMQKDYNLWESPLKDLCHKAADIRVRDFVTPPGEAQSVDIDDDLSKCLHLFVMNRHDALFVFRTGTLTGMLRFSDLYRKLSVAIEACVF